MVAELLCQVFNFLGIQVLAHHTTLSLNSPEQLLRVLNFIREERKSSAKSRSDSVTSLTRLHFLGRIVKPRCSWFLRAYLIASSRTMMNRNGASASPCNTPACISNASLSPSAVTAFAVVPVYVV